MRSRFFGTAAGESGIVLAGALISGLLGFGATLFAIRGLGPDQFGKLALLIAIMTLTAQFLDMGLSTTFVKFTSRNLQDDPSGADLTLKVTFLAKVALGALVLLIGLPLVGPVSSGLLHDESLTGFLYLALIGAIGSVLLEFCRGYLQAARRFFRLVLVGSVGNVIKLLFLALLFVLDSIDLDKVFLAYAVAPFFGFLVGWILIPHTFLRATGEKWGVLRELYGFTRWVTLSTVATMMIVRLDIFMLRALSTGAEMGYYASANQLAYIFPLITGSVTTVLLPRVSRYQDVRELRRYVRRVLGIAPLVLLIFIPLLLVASYLIPFLMGKAYVSSIPVFRVLILSFTISVIGNPVSLVFYNLDRPDLLAYLNLAQLALNFGLNYWLIPIYGAVGAALATLAVRVLGGFYIAIFLVRILQLRGEVGKEETG